MDPTLSLLAEQMGMPIWLLIIVTIWTLAWKAVAWWTAGRRNHIYWFIAFFIINTMGILEMFYVFVFSRPEFLKKFHEVKIPENTKKKRNKK